ncbi:hypothetical protein [uncultured Roseivirga sp.]|uniref:hypothetical protein n=1 Tax=uncultured Roseivirga sp. TaxID=543088 RepID=UPI000D794182|nr:hypothetical protein [uncultured Roseivirga sp.]PWL30035.1 MAG: hypothetical protein DCO95_09375 [Roseivirga sp. XM-24bin3]
MPTARIFELRKTRTFGQKLEGTFEFIRINAKPLFKSLFFFSSPFVLLGTFLVSNILSSSFNAGINSNAGAEPSVSELMSIGFSAIGFMFLMAFAGTMIVSTIYACVRCYEQYQSADYTTSEVWDRVKKIYWTIFGTTLLYGIVFFVAYMILIFPLALFAAVLSVLVIPVIYLFMGFYMVIMFTAIPAQIFEGKGIGSGLSQAFRLLKGNWWSSIGLLLLFLLIYNAVIVIFALPFYGSMIFSFFSTAEMDLMEETPAYMSLLNYLFGAILLIGSFLTYSIPLVGMTVQYFSLSEEKDATALMKKIDAFGAEEESSEEDEEEYH